MTTLDDMLNELAPEDRAHVDARAKELIMEERALQTLRKAKRLSQARMAELLNMRQDSVSRLERRSDLLISTLRSYIEAMGGSLKLMVNFPGQPSLALDSLDMKTVRAIREPVTVDRADRCSADQGVSFPAHFANLNEMPGTATHSCISPMAGAVILVGYRPPERVCCGDHGFAIKATLGTPAMEYKVRATDAPWSDRYEPA